MAQNNKFQIPSVSEQSDRQYANPPPIVEEAPFLREIANPEMIHPYSKEMAKRGDLVEAYWPPEKKPVADVGDKPPAKRRAPRKSVKSSADKEMDALRADAPEVPAMQAVPMPPPIPTPPMAPPPPPAATKTK